MKSHALYRFYGDTGQLLYVGITQDPGKRLAQHTATKNWWTSVRGISIDWYSSREDAGAAERRAITVERPLMNVQRPSVKPPTEVERRCDHCVGCVKGVECFVYAEVGPDEIEHVGQCRICDKPDCIFELGMEYGDQRGFSRAHDFYTARYGGGA